MLHRNRNVAFHNESFLSIIPGPMHIYVASTANDSEQGALQLLLSPPIRGLWSKWEREGFRYPLKYPALMWLTSAACLRNYTASPAHRLALAPLNALQRPPETYVMGSISAVRIKEQFDYLSIPLNI